MAICRSCTYAADANRKLFNERDPAPFWAHPTDCACPCQHVDPQQWEKFYLVEEPESASNS